MPKQQRDRSLSSSSSRPSPYPCSSVQENNSSAISPEDLKEWEEARCPVCMEYPHNAVLLLCSSHEKGCRPYMCDTSYRHSNCLDQFRKAFAETPLTTPQDDHPYSGTATLEAMSEATPMTLQEGSEAEAISEESPACDCDKQHKLMCPLCRGPINGWIIVDPARQFMNAKPRSCACETCDFSGTYANLRKHARVEHPRVRPTKADPERERDWRRMERERDIGDVLSTIQSAFGEEMGTEDLFSTRVASLSVLIFFRVSRGVPLPGSSGSSSWPSSPSTYRGQLRSRRRTTSTSQRVDNLDTTINSDVRESGIDPSEGRPRVRLRRPNPATNADVRESDNGPSEGGPPDDRIRDAVH